jgi:hypothetical protein
MFVFEMRRTVTVVGWRRAGGAASEAAAAAIAAAPPRCLRQAQRRQSGPRPRDPLRRAAECARGDGCSEALLRAPCIAAEFPS